MLPRYSKIIGAALCAMLLLSSCASGPFKGASDADKKVIANDFIAWMLDNDTFGNGTIQIRRDTGTFGKYLRASLTGSSVFIQTIPSHFVAPNLLSYGVVETTADNKRSFRYMVRIGNTEVRRIYKAKRGSLRPAGDFETKDVSEIEAPLSDSLVASQEVVQDAADSMSERVSINSTNRLKIPNSEPNNSAITLPARRIIRNDTERESANVSDTQGNDNRSTLTSSVEASSKTPETPKTLNSSRYNLNDLSGSNSSQKRTQSQESETSIAGLNSPVTRDEKESLASPGSHYDLSNLASRQPRTIGNNLPEGNQRTTSPFSSFLNGEYR